jgi:hypothetical protein
LVIPESSFLADSSRAVMGNEMLAADRGCSRAGLSTDTF